MLETSGIFTHTKLYFFKKESDGPYLPETKSEEF